MAPTPEQRLEGKAGTERQQELYYLCLEHFDGPIYGGGFYPGHEAHREALCHHMNKLNTAPEKLYE